MDAGLILSSYPLLNDFLVVVAILRLINKPLFLLLQRFVKLTPTKSDDTWLNAVENSTAYKVFLFALDWLASVKIKRP